jgi:hypothetical protein
MAKEHVPEARLFFVDTRFQKMARRPGGVSRESAIEQAQQYIDNETKETFDEWLEQELEALKGAIGELQSGPATPDKLDEACLHCRQLRDVGTTCHFELLTFIADSLCEILDATKAGAPFDADSVACHVDALMVVKKKSYRGLKPEQLPELTNGLRKVVQRLNNTHRTGNSDSAQ